MEPRNRSWMYNRNYPGRRGLREEFVKGVGEFIATAKTLKEFTREGNIKCPCKKCKGIKVVALSEVELHLYKKGFMKNYFVWTQHGEVDASAGDVNFQKISGNFERKVDDRLKDSLYTSGAKRKKSTWMYYDAWEKLNERWGTPRHQKRSTKGKATRSFKAGGLLHTDDKEKDSRPMTNVDVPKELYMFKNKEGQEIGRAKEYDQRTYTSYKNLEQERCESQASNDVSSTQPQPIPDDVTSMQMEVISGVKKDRAYGLGSQHCFGRLSSGLTNEVVDSLRQEIKRLKEEGEADRKARELKFSELKSMMKKFMAKLQHDSQSDSDSDSEGTK